MATPRPRALCELCQQNPKTGSYDYCSRTCATLADTLCSVCQQNPKTGSYDYCSRKCASIAATFCSHCHQKPKFRNFEHCGKTCRDAAISNTNPSGGIGGIAAMLSQVFAHVKGAPASVAPTTNASNNPKKLYPPFASAPTTRLQGPSRGQGMRPKVDRLPVSTRKAVFPVARRGFSRPKQQRQSRPRSYPQSDRNKPPENESNDVEVPKCLATGCEEYVQVKKGIAVSEYCSKEHEEQDEYPDEYPDEELCVMCQSDPQREADYFCGELCRSKAMKKE